ncbi:UNVERIFIED_CONTAM: hypothetical protein FKN15_001693 [Acipenser sinensis]
MGGFVSQLRDQFDEMEACAKSNTTTVSQAYYSETHREPRRKQQASETNTLNADLRGHPWLVVSTADCERGFSQMNIIHSGNHASMELESLVGRAPGLLALAPVAQLQLLAGSTAERDPLLQLLAGSTAERDPLLQLLAGSTAERDHPLQLLAGSTAERDPLLQLLAGSTAERDPLLQLLAGSTAERDLLLQLLADSSNLCSGAAQPKNSANKDAEKVTSLGKDWHRPCLKCEKCSKTLSSGSHAEGLDMEELKATPSDRVKVIHINQHW